MQQQPNGRPVSSTLEAREQLEGSPTSVGQRFGSAGCRLPCGWSYGTARAFMVDQVDALAWHFCRLTLPRLRFSRSHGSLLIQHAPGASVAVRVSQEWGHSRRLSRRNDGQPLSPSLEHPHAFTADGASESAPSGEAAPPPASMTDVAGGSPPADVSARHACLTARRLCPALLGCKVPRNQLGACTQLGDVAAAGGSAVTASCRRWAVLLSPLPWTRTVGLRLQISCSSGCKYSCSVARILLAKRRPQFWQCCDVAW